MATATETSTWPELAIGLYDKLHERNAEITYEFDHFELEIPSAASGEAKHAPWRMNGKLRITTNDRNGR